MLEIQDDCIMWMESCQGGFSSSALAMRKVLALDQAYGVYLTDRRLIVIKEKAETGWCWEPNGTSLFGALTTEVKPFLRSDPRSVEELDKCQKKLDAKLEDIVDVELKHPSLFMKGHITIRLKSSKQFKLLLLDSTEAYSKECFEAAKELLQKNLQRVAKVI